MQVNSLCYFFEAFFIIFLSVFVLEADDTLETLMQTSEPVLEDVTLINTWNMIAATIGNCHSRLCKCF